MPTTNDIWAVVETDGNGRPKRLGLAACLAGLVVAATALGAWWVVHKGAPIPIAVLPLVNLSQDPANDYLADGLTSEIISELSIIEGLAVRSQTSSFALKGKPRNVRDTGSQLQADYILEGSVLRDGQHLRINSMHDVSNRVRRSSQCELQPNRSVGWKINSLVSGCGRGRWGFWKC